MYLKSLEIQGFKSFPDKTLIRFGDDITAIVGPNGSGKSNISDAILWVLGEQSTKTLRGAKMEDVIFGGTQKRAAVGFAEATLTLDNTDRALKYDADEVMVTRRYYRSGDGEYYINRQSARLRDIHELFMDTGLGREGYSNIGQGRIDEILSLKSADRREIFEEAAGISKYRHRKEETERKLQSTEDNLLRINDKVTELEMQLEPLKIQAEKAKKYLELKDELQGVEVAVWLDTLDKLSAAAKKAEEDYTSASFVLEQAKAELDKLYDSAAAYGDELRARDVELEELRSAQTQMEAQRHELQGKTALLRSRIAHNDENIARIREEMQGENDRNSGMSAQILQTRQRIAEIEASLDENKNGLSDLSAQLAAAAANAQGVGKRILELRSREADLSAKQAGISVEIRSLEDARAQSSERAERLRQDLSSGDARLAQARQELEDCRKKLRTAKENAASNQNMLNGYRLRQKNREDRREQIAAALREKTSQLDGVQAKLRVFRAMERDFENYQKSVRMVMQEAQKGSLRNIHGPVSRLIRTEDDYTVAIEIALGGALQQIVVGNEQDGKAAIAYLKRTGGGRATFLPLSTVSGKRLQETGLESCNGFVGIASELVSCDPQYRGIVENLLGRTVIAEDIDRAISMASKYHNRFRIVTLDGQVMNAGGSMTGGSVNKDSGMLSRANELERLNRQAEGLEKEKKDLEEKFGEANRQADEVNFQIETVSEKLREAEDAVLRLEGQEKQSEILLSAITEAAENARAELQTLETRDQSDRERMASQEAMNRAVTTQLADVALEIEGLSGDQTQSESKTAAIAEKITQAKTEIAALEAEKVTAQSHMADLEQLRRDLEGDREKKQLMLDTTLAENAQTEQEIAALENELAEQDAALDAHKQKLQQVLATRMDAEAAKTKAEREAREKNDDILNMDRACSLLEQKKVTTAMEERQITDKLWDTYGLTPGTAQEHRAEIESVTAGNRRISELKRKIGALGTPNLGAIEEYARVGERYEYLATQREDVLTAKRDLEGIIRNLTSEMTSIFVLEFARINQYFGETFTEMFGGGKGELILEDPNEPLTCGIDIRVQPPGKQVKTITLLSGGEKAFVAIALYFAILKVRPTPFCMVDEIDAALDDRNVERYASYLHNLSAKTQFIVITHRRGTMEAADVLYGVTMQEQGISKLLRLDLNQMEQTLGITE